MNDNKTEVIWQQLTKLSFPILLGMIAELLYSLADMYFIAAIDKGSTHIVSGVGIVFPLIFLLTSVDQGIGKTSIIGIGMIASTLLNLLLDPIFIFVLELGVKGAALATVISQISLWLFVGSQYRKVNNTRFKFSNLIQFDKDLIKRIFKLAIPASLTFVILSVSIMTLNKFVSNINEVSLNAYTLVTRFDGILVTPALAFSIGISIMIGQNYGAGKIDQLKKIFVKGGMLITILTLILGGVYMIFARRIFLTMSSHHEVVEIATKQVLLLTIPIALGTSISMAAANCLQALEKATKAMLVTGFRVLFLTAPVILILELLFKSNIYLVWLGIFVGMVAGALIGTIWVDNAIKKISSNKLLT